MGMDWHSSGITTSVLGALKRGCAPIADELGLYICGGRGKTSRETPAELARYGERTGVDAVPLVAASRMVAKVDSAAVQDGFDLYLHGFVVDRAGRWTVVQQGMNPATKTARRYHWLGEGLTSFVEAPHAAIEGAPHGEEVVNLTDARAERSRRAQLELLQTESPETILRTLGKAAREEQLALPLPHLGLPGHHAVTARDVVLRRLARGASGPRRRRGRATLPICCACPGWARARCSRWRSWRRCSTARRTGSAIRRASPWPTAARTGTPSRFRSPSTTAPSR